MNRNKTNTSGEQGEKNILMENSNGIRGVRGRKRGGGVSLREAGTLFSIKKHLPLYFCDFDEKTDKIIGKSARNYKKGIVSEPLDLNKYV